MTLIAITGGIGAGKSVVSEVLRCLNFPVYDCDTQAKRLMDTSDEIKNQIIDHIHRDAVDCGGNLNRKLIADTVFSSPCKLAKLNEIVHGAVRQDIRRWTLEVKSDILFVETAILYQSGLDKMVDFVWEVWAPEELRVSRVCRRNNLKPQDVISRIEAQKIEVVNPHQRTSLIVNDDCHSVLLQIHGLLDEIKK